ncbi:MAG: hypothetical protein ACJAR9_001710, partial [Celeribacter sp.]
MGQSIGVDACAWGAGMDIPSAPKQRRYANCNSPPLPMFNRVGCNSVANPCQHGVAVNI